MVDIHTVESNSCNGFCTFTFIITWENNIILKGDKPYNIMEHEQTKE